MMKEQLEKLRINKDQKARRNERSNWPWILVILLLLIGGGVAYLYRPGSQPVVVQVIRVRAPQVGDEPKDLVALNATGYIMAAHKIALASKVIGRVAWVGVEMGQQVEKGEVIVRLEDDEYKARVAQAKAQLESAKARLAELKAGMRPQEIAQSQAQLDQTKIELENAKRVYNRLRAVTGTRTISQSEMDDAEAMVRMRQAQVDYAQQQVDLMKAGTRAEQIAAQEANVAQAEATLTTAMIDLDNTIIRAPMKSTILSRNVEAGEFVTTGFVGDGGAKGFVVSIADLKDLLVELDIDQNNFSKVSMDQPCWITTDAYPDRKYEGKVELISPVANRQKATIQVRVRALNPDEYLKPDMNATVAFLSPRAATGGTTQPSMAEKTPLVIPASALREGGVFVVESGRAKRRSIEKGMTTSDGNVEVKKGLIGGEDLIIAPPATLKPDDRVTAQPARS
jgi:HlyD family secretion protein